MLADPVVASDGHSYERTAIQDVLGSANKKSPLTREVLTRTLVPNHALRRRIEEHETELDALVEKVEAQVAGQASEARAAEAEARAQAEAARAAEAASAAEAARAAEALQEAEAEAARLREQLQQLQAAAGPSSANGKRAAEADEAPAAKRRSGR